MMSIIRMFTDFVRTIIRSRRMIGAMAASDFKVKYASSALGITWAFIQPIVQILVLIFVFSVGLRAGPTSTGVPFAVWLICGLVPWNFFADALTQGSNSLIEYHYLVKKVVFRTSILPIVKLLSALIIHAAFIILLLIVSAAFGYWPTWHTLQLLYYLPCLFFLLAGLNWITSALCAFYRDIAQVIGVVLQIMIWLTPILWTADGLPKWLQTILKLNPMYYIVQGYRDALLAQAWFWDKPAWTAYSLGLTALLFLGGAFMFHRLRPHFADVI